MPGSAITQAVRSNEVADEQEALREAMNREVLAVLRLVRGAINSVVKEVTEDYEAQPEDEVLLVNASGGDVTVTLPFAARFFRRLIVKRIDGSSKTVTIAAQADETIEGADSITLDSQWVGTDLTPRSTTQWVQASYSSRGDSLRLQVFELEDTALTLQAEHVFGYVATTASSAVTFTVEDDDSVFQVGDWVKLFQAGAGALTVAEGSGVTIRKPETFKFYKQYSSGLLVKRGSKLWDADIDAVLV